MFKLSDQQDLTTENTDLHDRFYKQALRCVCRFTFVGCSPSLDSKTSSENVEPNDPATKKTKIYSSFDESKNTESEAKTEEENQQPEDQPALVS
ncbi:unnamed protein product [Bemisia tabaci]|uniref:Uncharacterized protein n=1 Tax=Bemisia tabaci TaxID=7038 RepID=A0A9P0AJE9_BEMTA|nr:unnamed protein product [Bemisia tabaci]